jgi:hypothetical protein
MPPFWRGGGGEVYLHNKFQLIKEGSKEEKSYVIKE